MPSATIAGGPAQSWQRARSTLWRDYLLAGAIVALAYLALPPLAVASGWMPKMLLYNVLSASIVAAVVVGLRLHRPEHPLPWLLLGAGQLVYLTGDVVFYAYHLALGRQQFPSLADVFYLGHYPFVIAALLLLVRARTPGRNRASLTDAAIIAIGFGTAAWTLLIAPHFHDRGVDWLQRTVTLTYPIMDLLILAVAARLLVDAGRRGPAFYLLQASLAVMLASDTGYGVAQLLGSYQTGSGVGRLLDAGWIASYLSLGAAALHPSMRTLSERAPGATSRPTRGRLVLLAGASLIAPAVLMVIEGRDGDATSVVLAGACAMLFLLVVSRVGGLVRRVEASVTELRAQRRALAVTVDDLERLQAERRRLLDRTMRSAEEERRRLAAELHDGPIQGLVAVGYRLEEALIQLGDGAGGDGDDGLATLDQVRRGLSDEINGLRRLMTELRPPVLDERGLVLAMRDQVDAFERRTGVACRLAADLDGRLDAELETVLYRVTQEALNNVARHARAGAVQVELRADRERVQLAVHDDGVGFDVGEAGALLVQGHFGLAGMRERVEMAGGGFRLASSPGTGTTVLANLPRRRAWAW